MPINLAGADRWKISTTWFKHLTFRLLTIIRGGLVAIIFQHMTCIKSDTMGSAAALSLMSTDMDRALATLQYVLNLPADVVQVALALWILGVHLGAVCVAPVIIAIGKCLRSHFMGLRPHLANT